EEGRAFLQFSKFYADDAWKDVTEENYFKIKDQIARDCVEFYEKVTGVDLQGHIEEIVIASPVTWARYLGTPRGVVYGYEPHTWDGMFPRVQSGTANLDYTIKGLRFVGGHGTQMDGYSQAYLSGAEQARYTLHDIKEGK
ncbi:MAG: NAD(P)/FAD-dependent oxidoreductase, partial [Oscillospiraceae bacterium]|nr:NAD(P)/FAD-dependent oxidoreductase [Oscillospiraceae bacterium]